MTGYGGNGRGRGNAPNPRNEKTEYSLYLFHETPKAWQVGVERGDRENNKCFWLPKSQCQVVTEFAKRGQGQTIVLMVPLWLAEEKGLTKQGHQDHQDLDLVDDDLGGYDGVVEVDSRADEFYTPPDWDDEGGF